MRCYVCGSELRPVCTDLPFKTNDATIVVLKDLDVLQCPNCREYAIPDVVMMRVEKDLARISREPAGRCFAVTRDGHVTQLVDDTQPRVA